MSFGTGPFGFTPSGAAVTPAAEEVRSSISSSRKIDARGRYVINAEGGFEPMDDIAQTVLLRVAFAWKRPLTIDERALAAGRAQILASLKSMTTGPEPLIRDLTVEMRRSAPGELEPLVSYVNLRTNTKQTVGPT